MSDDTLTGCAALVLILLVAIFLFAPWKLSSLGTGEHSGFITSVDQRGYIFMNYDIYFKTDNSSSQEDTYCIHRDDEALATIAKQANKDRSLVVIHYKGVRGIGWGLCGHGQITSIDVKGL